MTKLMQWLSVLFVLLSVYLALVTGQIKSACIDAWIFQIQILPIVAVGAFGVYSVVTILYRVFTFNDCPEAADEIQKQIQQAKDDLTAKGFKFVD